MSPEWIIGDEKSLFCRNCGREYNEQDNFCHNCGTALNKTEPKQPNTSKPKKNNGCLGCLGCLGIIIIFLIVMGIYGSTLPTDTIIIKNLMFSFIAMRR